MSLTKIKFFAFELFPLTTSRMKMRKLRYYGYYMILQVEEFYGASSPKILGSYDKKIKV